MELCVTTSLSNSVDISSKSKGGSSCRISFIFHLVRTIIKLRSSFKSGFVLLHSFPPLVVVVVWLTCINRRVVIAFRLVLLVVVGICRGAFVIVRILFSCFFLILVILLLLLFLLLLLYLLWLIHLLLLLLLLLPVVLLWFPSDEQFVCQMDRGIAISYTSAWFLLLPGVDFLAWSSSLYWPRLSKCVVFRIKIR